MTDQISLVSRLENILEGQDHRITNITPSQWAEENRILTPDETQFPGPFSFQNSPYCREILDCVDVNSPIKRVAVMKGAQIGFSKSVIENAIGYIIANAPGPSMLLTGHSDLSAEAMDKVDKMIDRSGLRPLIRPNTNRVKSQKTGDTNKIKEFPGGHLIMGSANHKTLRQRDVRYMFVDDFEAMKSKTKESGATTDMVEQRLAAYFAKMKLFYISTPELKTGSNIEQQFLKGDQRRYYVPCPLCGEMITIDWNYEDEEGNVSGIVWKLDENEKVIKGSVGCVCPKCSGFFDDSDKPEMLNNGEWRPTAEPVDPEYRSYHISSLYSVAGTYTWEYYVRKYLEANPPNGERKEAKHQTFVNLVLGETFEPDKKEPKANQLQKNIRDYSPGTVPDELSQKDGNGRIVFLTCAADFNGKEEDARVDYEIVAWSENGSSYSVDHGSIGTFINLEYRKKHKVDREHWTYRHNDQKSVWPELERILLSDYKCESGRTMKVFYSAVDCGHFTTFVHEFIEKSNANVIGVRGHAPHKFTSIDSNLLPFFRSKEYNKQMICRVNTYKDRLADAMTLTFDDSFEESQHSEFMNFPTPTDGKYTYNGYFAHFEGEARRVTTKGESVAVRWEKVNSAAQNHFWDCRVYNLFLKDYIIQEMAKEFKMRHATWGDVIQKVFG